MSGLISNASSQSAYPLHVLAQGEGYPVLCLHGHPGCGRSMSVFTQHLSRRFRTLAPDLRGYGQSQTQEDFVMEDHLADLEALLDRQNISRCLVLGWSLGGILAMELALRQPERISGLVLVATAAYPRGSHPPISWQDNLFTGVAALVNWANPGWDWNIEMFGKRSLFRYLINQHTPETYQYLAQDAVYAYQKTSPQANRALNTALRQRYNRQAELEKIQVPCLVMAGEGDRHITAASSYETAQHLTQSEWHCYPNTAHLFPWEIPHLVLRDLDQWLERHPEAIEGLESVDR
ncbi:MULTISPECIES: alpha/beta hydrolase [unclassified Leptolyngbya]|uniref:alpha/beta fold hydrolase n=1 Tax=unclassified Leptolyngbya TaxID=2650499 RepID=UPI00168337C8|nr:alpha/beta hydrolase [Leptolyngbya sp. FACHB-8]MBD1912153.1 alpha/beta hydrolase [Leptolyngbya sp. FACHB-8]MBD2155044.1 alpha/beta hydrolase [Leptolyngbya sp. FACHB-16]